MRSLHLAKLIFCSLLSFGSQVTAYAAATSAEATNLSICNKIPETDLDKIDLQEAMRACGYAAETYPDNLKFSYSLGLVLFKMKEYGYALRAMNRAAAFGHSTAQFNLGYMYEKGFGADLNLTTAVVWYGRAAQQGNADALKRLKRIDGSGFNTSAVFAKYKIAVAIDEPAADERVSEAKKNDALLEAFATVVATALIAALLNGDSTPPAPPTFEDYQRQFYEDQEAARREEENMLLWYSLAAD